MYLSKIEISNYKGIEYLKVDFSPDINIIIGENVMMAEEVIILNQSHEFSDTSIPMRMQGYKKLTNRKLRKINKAKSGKYTVRR